LETEGQLKEACFSTDDRYIFAWTLGRHASNENRWYIWDAWTSVPIMNTSSSRVPVSNLGLNLQSCQLKLFRHREREAGGTV
jgi:hypothetical protein